MVVGEPHESVMVSVRRVLSILFCLLMAGLVASLAVGYFSADGIQWIDAVRIVLLAASTAWLAWGAAYASTTTNCDSRFDCAGRAQATRTLAHRSTSSSRPPSKGTLYKA
ncbi:MAG: hypothetical protein RLO21_05135, partial [Nitratireductor sp.]